MSLIVGALRAVFGADTAAFEKGVDQVDRKLKRSQKAFASFGKKVAGVGKSLSLYMTTPLLALGVASAQTGMAFEELQNAFDVTFKDSSATMREWAETTGDVLGRSTKEMQESSVAFASLFNKALDPDKANELTKQFSVLTQDLASFKDLSNDVAQQKLFSGLTGEAEPLKSVGVFINAAATEAKAFELGLEKVNGKFTDQQKIVARAALIQEQLADATGDVVRSQDSATNQLKRSQAAFEELRVVIGTKLLPILTPLIEKTASAFEWFGNLSDRTQNTILIMGGLVAALGPVLTVVGALSAVLAPLGAALAVATGATTGLAAAMTVALGPIGLVIAAVGLLTAAYVLNKKKTDDVIKARTELDALIKESEGLRAKDTASTVSQAKANLDEALSIRERMRAKIDEQRATLKKQQNSLENKKKSKGFSRFGDVGIAKVAGEIDLTTRAIAASEREMTKNLNEIDRLGKAYRSMGGEVKAVEVSTTDLMAAQKAAEKAAKQAAKDAKKLADAHRDVISDTKEEIEQNARLADALKVSQREYEITAEMISLVKDGFIGTDAAAREMAISILDSQNALQSVKDEADATAKALEDTKQKALDLAEANKEAAEQAIEDHRDITKSVEDEIIENGLLAEALKISQREYEITAEVLRLLEQGFTGTAEGARAMAVRVVESREKLSDIKDAAKEAEDALKKAGEKGADAFKDTLNSFTSLLGALKSGDIEGILGGILGAFDALKSGGGGGGGFASLLGGVSKLFGGFRAKGGPVSAGTSYIVGENGPELFTAPGNGNIVPNDKMGGTVNVVIEEGSLFRPVIRQESAGVAAPIAEVTTVRGISQYGDASRKKQNRRLA